MGDVSKRGAEGWRIVPGFDKFRANFGTSYTFLMERAIFENDEDFDTLRVLEDLLEAADASTRTDTNIMTQNEFKERRQRAQDHVDQFYAERSS